MAAELVTDGGNIAPSPTIHHDVCLVPSDEYDSRYRRHFAYHPGLAEFAPEVVEGYQWTAEPEIGMNISMAREWGSGPGGRQRVLRRTQWAMDALHMGSDVKDAIYAAPPYGNTDVVIVQNGLVEDHVATDRGLLVEAGAVFSSNESGRPIYGAALDCVWAMVVARQPGRPTLYGLVHSGRSETSQGFPAIVIATLRQHGYKPEDMYVALSPSLEPEAHTIQAHEAHSLLGSVAAWGKFAKRSDDGKTYNVDVAGRVMRDYMEAGVLPEHIEACAVGTYRSAAEGKGGSHRYAIKNQQPTPAFFIGIQIPRSRG